MGHVLEQQYVRLRLVYLVVLPAQALLRDALAAIRLSTSTRVRAS